MSNSTTVAKLDKYAALPYRSRGSSRTEVMLVTSRDVGSFPKAGRRKAERPIVRPREAFEEAGIVGLVDRRSVGSFPYQKRLENGGLVVCVARAPSTQDQVALCQGGSQSRPGARVGHDHSPLGTCI